MKKIYYLAYFDVPENAAQNRNYVLSATTKSSYICETIAKLGYDVTIVSASATRSDKFCKGMEVELCENLHLHLFDSLPSGNIINRIRSRINMKKQLAAYLKNNVKAEDTLIVYHSLSYIKLVQKIKKSNKPQLIIESNEVYADVIGNEKIRVKEMKFLRSADSYIISTELLNEKVNKDLKPFVINYGTYKNIKKTKSVFNDNKIHCVYAGTLDPRKGCLTAVQTAKYLDENYRIHILGFGSEDEKNYLFDEIGKINAKSGCKVSYDGLLSGENYLSFIGSCQVGLSTQASDAKFNETSFPSKVLSYLSNGLRVVSVRIKSIESSEVSGLLYFYDKDDPKVVARAIRSIDFKDNYDSREIISKLDLKFNEAIRKML